MLSQPRSYLRKVFVSVDTVATLDLCLEGSLRGPAFKRDIYRSGEFSGVDQPELVRTLAFVSAECADMAARYVNGNWSEINFILPMTDRSISIGKRAIPVMDSFLTLREHAATSYQPRPLQIKYLGYRRGAGCSKRTVRNIHSSSHRGVNATLRTL